MHEKRANNPAVSVTILLLLLLLLQQQRGVAMRLFFLFFLLRHRKTGEQKTKHKNSGVKHNDATAFPTVEMSRRQKKTSERLGHKNAADAESE
jgi:hypothetical protein